MPHVVRRLIWGALAGLGLAATVEGYSILIGQNFHTVIPGQVYRCAQPSSSDLDHYVAQYGIKTVINLRGCCAAADWYEEEARATARLDIAQEDFTFSAGHLPAPAELRRLLEALDRAEKPLLIHCKRGVDRTGLTSTMAKMLYGGATLAKARRQLRLNFGHVSLGRTEAMLHFFDLYDRWRNDTHRKHSRTAFREFVATGYAPGPAYAQLRVVNVPEFKVEKPAGIVIRVRNEGLEDWQLRAGTGAGIHLRFQITDANGKKVQEGFAGLFDAVVPRRESIDLTLALAGLSGPGTYTLTANMFQTPEISFAQLGSEPLTLELRVP